MSILVVGSVALDTVSTPFGKIDDGLGGSATHFSVSASFFDDVSLVAVVGEDFPQKHIEFLKSRKISLKGLEVQKGETFRWKGKYLYDLNQAHTLSTELNVFQNFSPKLLPEHLEIPWVFLANIDPELQIQVVNQVCSPKLIALDTMNFWIDGKREFLLQALKKINLLFLNESEARDLSQETNLLKAYKKIRSWGPETVVIKRGEYGAILFQDEKIFAVPGLPLEEIKDPTGAGDSFAGGFLGYVARTGKADFETFKKACIYGSVMASFNVENFSLDRLRSLTKEEIEKRYKEFENLTLF